MDITDVKILNHLKRNARVNASVIGRDVNMSVSAVIERIRKLERDGIILQYTVLLNNQKIGHEISSLVFIKADLSQSDRSILVDVFHIPNVVECCAVTGEHDFMLRIVTASVQETSRVVNKIAQLPYVSSVSTNIVLTTLKSEYSIIHDN